MDYFNILNLIKEPFSNSPDPDFFYQSRQHQGCLQQLEISLRLRRGLNVVIGDVGIGKTTICRQLIRNFTDNDDTETHLILDPHFMSPDEFIYAVAEKFEGEKPVYDADTSHIKERIKQYLFRKGVQEEKNVILIIDEGQKLPTFCLEIIREFLNYETNKYKLLQIVIFAQAEFEKTIKAHAYFADRINFYHRLKAFNFNDTRAMINYRLRQSSDGSQPIPIFSVLAFWAIYSATGGYPRKIVNLCHQCIMAMLVQNRNEADWLLVRGCARNLYVRRGRFHLRPVTVMSFLVLVLVVYAVVAQGLHSFNPASKAPPKAITLQVPRQDFADNQEMPPTETSKPYLAAIQALSAEVDKHDTLPPADSGVSAGGGENGAAMPPPAAAVVDTPRAPETSPAASTPPAAVKQTPSPKAVYTVQAGAFREPNNARRRVAAMIVRGFDAYIYRAKDGRGHTWHTVRIGTFDNMEDARLMIRKLKDETKMAAFITLKNSLKPVTAPVADK